MAPIGIAVLLMPGVAAATSVNVPLAWDGEGAYLAGFEVETMEDEISGESVSGIRYLARLTWRALPDVGLSLRAGGSRLDVESTGLLGAPLNFEGDPKFAAGAGATWLRPLRGEKLGFFADAQVLYTLSYGNTDYVQSIQLSTYENSYENRIAWNEYQGAFGMQMGLPWARFYTGVAVRSVNGSVSRKTFQNGDLMEEGKEDFSKEPASFGLFGIDIPFASRMVFSAGALARDADHFSWTIGISEFSR